jgi:hypothetical protein
LASRSPEITWIEKELFLNSSAGTNLEEEHQLEAVSEINIDGFNTGSGFSEVGIAPSCEGLKNN